MQRLAGFDYEPDYMLSKLGLDKESKTRSSKSRASNNNLYLLFRLNQREEAVRLRMI